MLQERLRKGPFIPVADAQEALFARLRVRETQEIPLASALGHVLAEDIRAPRDVPPFDRSLQDGFALRSEDVPGELRVVEELPAGSFPTRPLRRGEAARVMTGAPVPPGADAVVPFEIVDFPLGSVGRKGETIVLSEAVPREFKVQRKGSDFPAGTNVLRAGTRIGAAELAALSALGFSHIRVYRKPSVAVLSTGEELRNPPEDLSPAEIYDANGPFLVGLLAERGFPVRYAGRVPDRMQDIVRRARELLQDVDVLVTSGGVSVGDTDIVPFAAEAADLEVVFRWVAMRPGKSTTAAVAPDGAKLWLALHGNPAAAYVAAHLFLLPALCRLSGETTPLPERHLAVLRGAPGIRETGGPIPYPLTQYYRGKLRWEGTTPVVDAARIQLSPYISSFLDSDVLVEIPHDRTVGEGDLVHVVRTACR
ncbi:molybdopterin molybdotransferase MoeA [Brockia lithotrophica]|uniref:Molybdopterin molybdenumtransferase n=1 Tax=Brockia lithotrophica TaxID=933949 RepID=A0A660L4E8_9BACL|nr:molybdopterin molybdotransferase MoeA [Brockia lithotrophica]RKQ88911.1 molybdopterin molybdochelatase [Brockia lithotrophica]